MGACTHVLLQKMGHNLKSIRIHWDHLSPGEAEGRSNRGCDGLRAGLHGLFEGKLLCAFIAL